jgi:hypothetical protein
MGCPRARRTLRVYQFIPAAVLAAAFLPLTGVCQAPPTEVAQAPAGPATAQPAATLNTAAEEVSLDLVVRTKSGKPILDLKPEELSITDDGAP